MKQRVIEILVLLLICGVVFWLLSPKLAKLEMYRSKTIELGTYKTPKKAFLDKDTLGNDRQIGLINLQMLDKLIAKHGKNMKLDITGRNIAIIYSKAAENLLPEVWIGEYKFSFKEYNVKDSLGFVYEKNLVQSDKDYKYSLTTDIVNVEVGDSVKVETEFAILPYQVLSNLARQLQ